MNIVRTSIDNYQKAKEIGTRLLQLRYAASVHLRKVESLYRWNDNIKDITEYEIEVICEDIKKVYDVIKEMHTYELPEYIIYDNIQSTVEFAYWVECNCQKDKLLKIRKGQPSDLDNIYDLAENVYKEDNLRLEKNDYARLLLESPSVVVETKQGTVIGFAVTDSSKEDTIYKTLDLSNTDKNSAIIIKDIVVSNNYRGDKLQNRMTKFLINLVRDRFNIILCQICSSNRIVIHNLEEMGFKRYKELLINGTNMYIYRINI